MAITPIRIEKCLLQLCMLVVCLVPVVMGGAGGVFGVEVLDGQIATFENDSHFRFMSGLLLGIGAAFLSCIPHVERKTQRVRLLTAIVYVGGLSQLGGALYMMDTFQISLVGAIKRGLVLSLIIVPFLCLWQGRIAKKISG